ncbi:hypothetical protein [Exiguobacterium sp. S22-S28]|uniref:hypothetical protein n=1 Tax=Exiguobacterium sp. S22-S28 TaxID=3342768 RepID=UPI00372D0B10
MDMKKLLPHQRSLFVLGDVGSERYALFRSYTSSHANLERYWRPEDSKFKQCTWVLFSSDEALCYEWTEDGLSDLNCYKAGGTYFVSVSPGQIPLNVKLVFPPYFTSENSFTSYFEQSPYVNSASSFIWLEGFPYGKADTVKQLRYLQGVGITKKQISVAITQIEREFVLSDIGNVEVGIRNAENYFLHKGYRIVKDYALIPLQRSILLEALILESSYVETIIADKQEVLKNIQASLMFLKDDLQFALEREQWVVKLEQCFAYANIKSSSIYTAWLKQLKGLLEEMLVYVVKEELVMSHRFDQIQHEQNIEKDLQSIIQLLWNELERKLKTLQHQKFLSIKYVNQIDYELQTRELKVQFYDCINDTVQRRLPTEIHGYIENMIKKYLVTL